MHRYIINQLLDVFLPAVPKATSIWKTVERLHKKNTAASFAGSRASRASRERATRSLALV
jgi:hypothetical protein